MSLDSAVVIIESTDGVYMDAISNPSSLAQNKAITRAVMKISKEKGRFIPLEISQHMTVIDLVKKADIIDDEYFSTMMYPTEYGPVFLQVEYGLQ
jgi:hypothetical protein